MTKATLLLTTLLLANCSPKYPDPGWEETWMKHQFSYSGQFAYSEERYDISSRDLSTPYSGKWVRLTHPMRLVTYRGNYDADWHQLLDMSMRIPEPILNEDSRFCRAYTLPVGTELYVVGAKEFKLVRTGETETRSNRYVMLVRLWHPDFHRMVGAFYNIGNLQEAEKQLPDKSFCPRYRSLKPLPFEDETTVKEAPSTPAQKGDAR